MFTKFFKSKFLLLVSSLIFGLMTFFVSCSDITDPQTVQHQPRILNMMSTGGPVLSGTYYTEQWVDGSGGTVEVGDATVGISKLVFPAGALSDSTFITFDYPATGDLVITFEPPVTFNLPIGAELSYKNADLTGVNEDDLRIWWWNENTSQWELTCWR